jgi:SAM-dependent methyltransferase
VSSAALCRSRSIGPGCCASDFSSMELLVNNIQSFSLNSELYAKHRPQYPDELFSFLSDICEQHDCAWDCATGNGQAAVSCAKYFLLVQATDISTEQIQHCITHPKVHYSLSSAEHTSFKDQSFDLVMVAQAIHWFDEELFFKEVDRVLKPKGILAVWGYGFLEIEREIDDVIAEYLLQPIERFWASGNHQVMDGYRELSLPYNKIQTSNSFRMSVQWNLPQLLAYFRTWSAVKRYLSELGDDPVDYLEPVLKLKWNDPDRAKLVQMPLFLKVSRKTTQRYRSLHIQKNDNEL